MKFTRREALIASLLAMSASKTTFAEDASSLSNNPICVFTKPFNSLSFGQLADEMAALGVQGIEAPIRKGGHIEPTDVEEKLPKLVDALKQRGLEITLLTSDINDPGDQLTAKVLKTAASLGIQRYRMKYFNYDLKRSVIQQIQEWRPIVRDLAAMNKELGIRAVYQNHAGNKQLGAALWDLRELLQGIDPKEIGVAYDIRHATVEGGMSWPITFNMIRPHLDTVYVKDALWEEKSRPKNVPLGDGIVNPQFFKLLAQSGFTGPISLHEEYLDHRRPELVPDHLAAIKHDLAVLKEWLASAG